MSMRRDESISRLETADMAPILLPASTNIAAMSFDNIKILISVFVVLF